MSWTWYGWLFLLSLLVGGAYAIVDLIKNKNPKAGEIVEKVAAYQGYLGLGLILFSAWNLILMLKDISIFLRFVPVTSIVLLAALVTGLLLGLLESLGILGSWKVMNQDTLTKIEQKLSGIKIPLGFVAIGTSIYLILAGIIRWTF